MVAYWDLQGGQDAAVADVLLLISKRYAELGRYDRSELHLKRALSIREKLFGSESRAATEVRVELGLLYVKLHQHQRAEPFLIRALAREAQISDAPVRLLAPLLSGLAAVYQERGEYERAEPLLERALAIVEGDANTNDSQAAPYLRALASLHMDLGDHEKAEALLFKATSVLEQEQSTVSDGTAPTLDALATLYTQEAKLTLAEPLFKRALSLREEGLGPDHPEVAESLNHTAAMYIRMQKPDLAEPLLRRALSIQEETFGQYNPLSARTLTSMAEAYNARGDTTHAEEFAKRALDMTEATCGGVSRHIVAPLVTLATIYLRLKDYDRARTTAERVLMIDKKSQTLSRDQVRSALSVLFNIHLAQGRAEEALKDKSSALFIEDALDEAHHTRGSESDRSAQTSALLQSALEAVSLHVQALPRSEEAATLALTAVLRRKGLLLDVMADTFAALHSNLNRDDIRLLNWLSSVRSRLATSLAGDPKSVASEQYRADVISLQEDQQRILKELSGRSADLLAQSSPVTIKQVQEAIPDGAALLEIFRYRALRVEAGGDKRWGEPGYVAYVIHPEQPVSWVDLGDASQIDTAVERFRAALARPASDPRSSARQIDALVMQPVRRLLRGAQSIVLSPDGALNLVPFGAFIDEHGRYLIEQLSFTYLSSGRDLVRFETPAVPREDVAIIGGPAYGERQQPAEVGESIGRRSNDMAGMNFPPLRAAAAEARSIGETIPHSRLLTGAEATEAALKAMHGPRILHIATHGFFLPDQGDTITKRPARKLDAEARGSTLENPLLRSGIALAGANERATRSGDDGILTALEASGLDLFGTKLVVLSACETGIGQATNGDGVYGLRRALAIAGAETQIMSLWKVDDAATRDLMIEYYKKLQAGGERSESMRAVQLSMIANEATSHPFYWASFIVSGNGAPLDGGFLPPVQRLRPGPLGCGCTQVGVAGRDAAPFAWNACVVIVLAVLRIFRSMYTVRRKPNTRSGTVTWREEDKKYAPRAHVALLPLALATAASAGCAAPLTCPAHGGAPWTELVSRHFVVNTDLDEADARAAVADLEVAYTTLSDIGFRGAELGIRPNVILFKREADYHQVSASESRATFYNKLGGDIEFKPAIAMYGELDEETRLTFQEELARLFIDRDLGGSPSWLSEGLARYYSTLRIKDGIAYVGTTPPYLGFARTGGWRWEQHGPWFQTFVPPDRVPSVSILLEANHEAFNRTDRGGPSQDEARMQVAWRSGAWMLVHMLNGGSEKLRDRYNRFLQMLGHGKRWREAWELCFGDVSPGDLEADFRRYLAGPDVMLWTQPYVPRKPARLERVSRMPDASVHLLWARLYPWTGGENRKGEALWHLHEAAASEPFSPEVRFWQGLFFMNEKQHDAAEREFLAALTARPDEPRYLLGLASLYWDEPDPKRFDNGRITSVVRRLSGVATTPMALRLIARYYYIKNDTTKAMAYVRRAIQAHPGCWSCLKLYAQLLFERGLVCDAIDNQERAINALPDHESDESIASMKKLLATYQSAQVSELHSCMRKEDASSEDLEDK